MQQKNPGAQIDLLIDRRDQVINICEMKYAESEFVIDKKYSTELENKRTVFKQATGTKKSLFLTMLTTFGLKENEYSGRLVQNSLTMDDLFK
ncbi:MAG: ATPase [Chitinophagaceae bacterium]|nr:ATPase [Chitinophagaceae bacterium]